MEMETNNKYLQANTQAVADENFPEYSETRPHLTPLLTHFTTPDNQTNSSMTVSPKKSPTHFKQLL